MRRGEKIEELRKFKNYIREDKQEEFENDLNELKSSRMEVGSFKRRGAMYFHPDKNPGIDVKHIQNFNSICDELEEKGVTPTQYSPSSSSYTVKTRPKKPLRECNLSDLELVMVYSNGSQNIVIKNNLTEEDFKKKFTPPLYQKYQLIQKLSNLIENGTECINETEFKQIKQLSHRGNIIFTIQEKGNKDNYFNVAQAIDRCQALSRTGGSQEASNSSNYPAPSSAPKTSSNFASSTRSPNKGSCCNIL